MRVLLSGATGYLGRNLARSFVESQHEVIVLQRKSSGISALDGLGVEVCELGSETLQQVIAAAGPIDVVVHTATSYGRRGESVSDVCRTNTLFALELLDASVQCRVPIFLNTDTALPANVNAYSLSKKHFRDWGVFFADQGSTVFMNVRLEYFFGPGDGQNKFITHVVRQCLENSAQIELTKGEQQRDFIYIDDVLSAYGLLLGYGSTLSPGFYEYSLGLGEGRTLREIVEMVHSLCGSTTELRFGALPYRPNEVMRSVADPHALYELGWRPRFDLHEGLKHTIKRERLA